MNFILRTVFPDGTHENLILGNEYSVNSKQEVEGCEVFVKLDLNNDYYIMTSDGKIIVSIILNETYVASNIIDTISSDFERL